MSKVKSKHRFKIRWHPITILLSDEHRESGKRNLKIEWKVRLFEHLAIQLAYTQNVINI